jgi:hypothetical protein
MHTFQINVSTPGIFYVFPTSCVHHQEDHFDTQFCTVCFSYIYVSSLAGGRMCSDTSFHLREMSRPVQELDSLSQVLPHMFIIWEVRNWSHLLERGDTVLNHGRALITFNAKMVLWLLLQVQTQKSLNKLRNHKKFMKLWRTQHFLSTWMTFWCIYNRIFPHLNLQAYKYTNLYLCLITIELCLFQDN